jgi:molybdenum cofactor biosynthesis enzyme MoaA
MAFLNSYNDNTKSIIHLMVTSLCDRNCKYCCNKQYDLNSIPYVTDEELREAHTLCLTGGEPFIYSNPCTIAAYYKKKYKNIKNVFVYTNAYELANWLNNFSLHDIDGLNISIKNKMDAKAFEFCLKNNPSIVSLGSNRLYVFDNLYPIEQMKSFEVFAREWQPDFNPATDSIFRRC